MTTKDSLGDRMKAYEVITQNDLMRRTPVVIRIDGRAFHTFTQCLKGLDPSLATTPFSVIMHYVMVQTTRHLVEGIQNCVIGYTQSDEISLILKDWDELETQQWFGGNVQKIVSSSASIATAAFNHAFSSYRIPTSFADLANFDSRVHNIPSAEVVNYLIWRQQDASRNSVQMLGRFHFSQKQMHGKNNNQVQDMLMAEHGINWNDIPTWMKRGSCVTKSITEEDRVVWGGSVIDDMIPIFTQDRDYIESRMLTPSQREHINGN
jgi:tRNA(His) 5'-end guanylyltransferase